MNTGASDTLSAGHACAGRSTPEDWACSLSAPPDFTSTRKHWPGGLLRQWTGTAPEMVQPPLDHHYVVQHLGGAKLVERQRDGLPLSKIVECGALTLVPAGTEFRWRTRGPIQFAHLYLSPQKLADVASRLDHLNELSLVDRVGFRDPLLESLYAAMTAAVRGPRDAPALYMDALLEAFVIRLLLRYSTARLRPPKGRETLAKFQLDRVIEFINANLGRTLTLLELSEVAGRSVFHFSRAFRNATGEPPYRYLLRLRIERAKWLLDSTSLPLVELSALCGFHDATHFSRTFSRLVGSPPTRYRHRFD